MTFDEFLEEWHGAGNTIRVHTSGSTGKPKTIDLEKDFVAASARRTNHFFGIDEWSRLHSCVSADFIGGKMMAVRSTLASCSFTYEKPSNNALDNVTQDEKIDLLAVVPSQMLHILERRAVLPEIRNIIIGGSAIHPGLREKICESGLNAYETYGMTETASHIALRHIDPSTQYFTTLPGITVALDARECIVIRYGDGKEIITNDLGRLASEREFMIDGRVDDVIVTGGKKLNPHDVERRLRPILPGEYIVTSVPDEKWGEMVVLKMEGRCDTDDARLISLMKETLQPWEVPKRILHVERLERTPNGKLKR